MTLNPVDQNFADSLRAALPDGMLRETEPRYLEEPRGRWFGRPGLVVLPRNVEQVSTIIRHAAAARVGVVPYSGGTGLVSGQIMEHGPAALILSLEQMNTQRAIYPDENVAVMEAGAILSDVQDAAERVGRLFPLSLAAEGSACIGGNLSTNAGGTAVLRYGNAREMCLGIEAVLPDGQILHGLSRLRKNNMGYDLRHLLIGAEGTLGVITAAALKLFPRPSQSGTAIFTVRDPEAALRLLGMARDQLGDMVSGFELLNRQGFEFIREFLPDVRLPFSDLPQWAVLIELGLSGGLEPAIALETLFEAGAGEELVEDGHIAQNQQQSDDFWRIREMFPEGNRLVGMISSHDTSLPLGAIPEFVRQGAKDLAKLGDFRINCFGHLGDGNLHYNVFPAKGKTLSDYVHMRDDVKRVVHDLAHSLGGSVSAEHGIGRQKVGDLERYGDPAKLSAMRAIKAALDPVGIMNPGAVLRNC